MTASSFGLAIPYFPWRSLFRLDLLRRVTALLALTLAASAVGRAQTIFVATMDIEGSSTSGVAHVYNSLDTGGSVLSLASSFTTGSGDGLVLGVILVSDDIPTFNLSLYSDGAGRPDQLVSTYEAASDIGEGFIGFLTTDLEGALLAYNTTYWLVATPIGEGAFSTLGTTTTGVLISEPGWSAGSVYYTKQDGGEWTAGTDGEQLQFIIVGFAIDSAVPEPSTYAALAGGAMLGFAAWRRRQARRTTTTS